MEKPTGRGHFWYLETVGGLDRESVATESVGKREVRSEATELT